MGPRTTALALSLLSALLLWLSFFPVNAGWLGWVALTPLLMLCRLVIGNRWRYFAAYLGGLAFFLGATNWMRVADDTMYLAWIGMSIYIAVYFPLAVFLLRRLDRLGLPLVVAAPIVWPATEYLRGELFGGFAWYFLGHTQHDFAALAQSADLGGVVAVTMMVAAVNGLIADALTTELHRRIGVAVVCVLLVALGYGHWRLSQNTFSPGPRVALLQSNVPQGVKDDAGVDAVRKVQEQFTDLQRRVMTNEKPDLIVWPETSLTHPHGVMASGGPPFDLRPEDRSYVEACAGIIESWVVLNRVPNLFGVNVLEFGPDRRERKFNSALLADASGRTVARYDKIHRVPFGEYVPFVETLPFLKIFTPYGDANYSVDPGTEYTRFAVPTAQRPFQFGALICYEDSDASLARQYVRGPDKVDFLVNISNDGWFKGTAEHEQHLAVSRFRAIECRRALVRAVNMGVSAVIDSNGQVVALPGESWHDSKAIAGVVMAVVPIDDRASLYAWTGDWLAWLCWLAIVGGVWKGTKR